MILAQLEDLSKKDCEKKLFDLGGEKKIPKETTKRVSKDQVKVSIILSDETQAEVEKLKSLLGKDLSMDELIKFMARTAIAKVEKDKFRQTEKPKSLPPAQVKRTPASEVKREVYKRDKCCTKCGSLHNLNFDHTEAYAHGCLSDLHNIRLLCFNCNQRSRIEMKLGPKAKEKFQDSGQQKRKAKA